MTMFPEASLSGTSNLPDAAAFWMPKASEVGEEGFGFFRDTWLIKNISATEARGVISTEQEIAKVVSELAQDEDDFERLAAIAEYASVDDPAEEISDEERRALGEVVSDMPELCGLELGVAGLSYALASVRILPAASCRSHPERSWSDAPVVLFASTEFRAKALQPLVMKTGCTFEIDLTRPELLVVRGRTIQNTMALAEAVMDNRRSFVKHRSQCRHARTVTRAPSMQEPLF